MNIFKCLAMIVIVLMFTGCMDNKLHPKQAKAILEARTLHANDVKEYTTACMKAANSNRDVVYNDSNEVANTCFEQAQRVYGTDSQWNLDFIRKQAAKVD